MSHEPLSHLGFKIIATVWGMCTIGYMNRSLELKMQKINLFHKHNEILGDYTRISSEQNIWKNQLSNDMLNLKRQKIH